MVCFLKAIDLGGVLGKHWGPLLVGVAFLDEAVLLDVKTHSSSCSNPSSGMLHSWTSLLFLHLSHFKKRFAFIYLNIYVIQLRITHIHQKCTLAFQVK